MIGLKIISFKPNYVNFIIVFAGLFALACSNSKLSELNEEDYRYVGKIKVSAGDVIDYTENDTLDFMAFPMNVAIATTPRKREIKVYLIGKSMRKEQTIAFKPVALMKYAANDGTNQRIVVGRPVEDKWVTSKVNNYFELITVYYGVQQHIESWVKNAYGYGFVNSISWEDEKAAENYLNE